MTASTGDFLDKIIGTYHLYVEREITEHKNNLYRYIKDDMYT